jgi:hypothetical protein
MDTNEFTVETKEAGNQSEPPKAQFSSSVVANRGCSTVQRTSAHLKIILNAPVAPQGSLIATNLAAVIRGALKVLLFAAIAGGAIAVAIMIGMINAGFRRR